jgi:membrane fusion protein (multidrug efflux system)
VPTLAPDQDDVVSEAPMREQRPPRDDRADAVRDDGSRAADAAQERPQAQTLIGKLRRRPWVVAGLAIAFVLAVTAGVIWWLDARQYQSTDDAFVDARSVSISSQVNGAIVDVPVTDNQVVEAGAVLLRIDHRDYLAAFNQARAQAAQAQANIDNLNAQIDAQQARIDQAQKQAVEAEGALKFAREENQRYQELVAKGAGTLQRAQQAESDLRQRQAAFDAAQANTVAAEKQIAVLKTQHDNAVGQLDQARAAEAQAEANLARTTITAPVAGRVTKLTAAVGGYAQTGQSLMMFVPREVWVTANFKETQLANMRPGEPVEIRVDAFPGRVFQGHIDSVQAGSGTAFSLLPAENATGNFVKIVQRVPVKITFDTPPDVLLGPGMSVVPTVKVR